MSSRGNDVCETDTVYRIIFSLVACLEKLMLGASHNLFPFLQVVCVFHTHRSFGGVLLHVKKAKRIIEEESEKSERRNEEKKCSLSLRMRQPERKKKRKNKVSSETGRGRRRGRR